MITRHKIRLKSGEEFHCEDGESILAAAVKAGLFLEHSCKTGRCETCLVRVEGVTKLVSGKNASECEKDDKILSCTRSAASELYIDAENLELLKDYKSKILPARINSLELLNDDVLRITLRTPPSNKLHFLPGQYLNMIDTNGSTRSYSIANAPRDSGTIDLHIKRVEGGLFSDHLFLNARQDDLLRINGPQGSFFLRSALGQKKHLVFLATGTGIAPIKAILESLDKEPEGADFESVSVFWGGRFTKDIYWQPKFERLSIQFVKVLSRERVPGFDMGYVQDAFLRIGPSVQDSVVYACGGVAMISAAKEKLGKEGLDLRYFYSDAFVSSEEVQQ